jgi:hypothetical protein
VRHRAVNEERTENTDLENCKRKENESQTPRGKEAGTEDSSLGAMTLKTAAPELKGGEKGKTHSEGWANNGEQAQLTAQEDRA